jgi:hypothetical protein
MTGTGQAILGHYVLHPILVAEVAGGFHVDTGYSELLTHDRQRNLKLLKRAQYAIDSTQLPAEGSHSCHEVGGVESVVDPEVGSEAIFQLRAESLARVVADQTETHTWRPSDGIDEPRGRREKVGRNEHHVGHLKTVVALAGGRPDGSQSYMTESWGANPVRSS